MISSRGYGIGERLCRDLWEVDLPNYNLKCILENIQKPVTIMIGRDEHQYRHTSNHNDLEGKMSMINHDDLGQHIVTELRAEQYYDLIARSHKH